MGSWLKDAFAKVRAWVNPESAFSRAGQGDGPRVEFSVISAKIGLPEERIAQMAQMIRTNGMEDAQMAAMMRMATEKGVTREEISAMLASMGISKTQVVRVMQAEGLMEPEEADRILEAERRAAAERAEADASGARRAFLRKAVIIAFWLVVWELLDRVVDNRLVLAGPIRTFQALCEQVVQVDFWSIVGASFGRIALGFLLSFVVGFVLALAAHRFRLFRDFVEPLISLLRTIPVASFIILLLIWVGNQALTVFLAFFIVLPLIYTNMVSGFESVDKQMLKMARTYGLSKWRTFLYVYRPAFMPFLLSSTKISLGMTWKSGIMAEVLATPLPSIGREMSTARTFLDTPDLLAWTVVVMVCSVLFEQAFMWLLKRANRPMGGMLGAKGEGAAAGAGVVGAGAPDGAADGAAGGATKLAASPVTAAATPAAAPADVQFENVCKAYGANQVLRSVNFDLAGGSATCLMAASGSGKTTLFRVLLGLEPADSGRINGIAPERISMMFQEDRLCSTLTPVENVALVLPASASRADIRKLLAEVLPPDCLDQPAMELSGGMRRRVSLVRAVAHESDLVVLDEPFTGLDAQTRRRVIEFLLRHKGNRTLLVATHGEGDAELLGATRLALDELQAARG